MDAIVSDLGLSTNGQVNVFKNVGTPGTPSFDYWGDGIDSKQQPHISEQFNSWGGSIAVADFDNDGLPDVLIGGDALFHHRGATTPKLVDLGLGTSAFAGTAMGRTTIKSKSIHGVVDLMGPGTGLGFLYVDFSNHNPPVLRHSSLIIAADESTGDNKVQAMTKWLGKVAFSASDLAGAANQHYGSQHYMGIRLSNAGDMNGDGLADWITSQGKIFLATGSTSQTEPAFEYWSGKDILSNLEAGSDLTTELLSTATNPTRTNDAGWAFAPGDVDNDGVMDLVVGACLKFAWPSVAGAITIRLTYLRNIGTAALPLFKRIKHGEAGYPFPGITYSMANAHNGRSFTPALGDVNGDGFLDLIVSSQGGDGFVWDLSEATLYINNQDGTFTSDVDKYGVRKIPTGLKLFQENRESPRGVPSSETRYTPVQLIDRRGDGFSDVFISGGDTRQTGALVSIFSRISVVLLDAH